MIQRLRASAMVNTRSCQSERFRLFRWTPIRPFQDETQVSAHRSAHSRSATKCGVHFPILCVVISHGSFSPGIAWRVTFPCDGWITTAANHSTFCPGSPPSPTSTWDVSFTQLKTIDKIIWRGNLGNNSQSMLQLPSCLTGVKICFIPNFLLS